MPYRRRRERMHLNAEINVVNLIDVMLLLLVIFMLTAPMMTGGVDLRLPSGEALPVESNRGLVITITADGKILVGKEEMTLAAFRAAAPTLGAGPARDGVFIHGDVEARYGLVAQIFSALSAAKVTNISLVMQPEEGGP